MDSINYNTITIDRKTLSFPPHVEKVFLLDGLASRVTSLKTGIFILLCLNLFLQYYNFGGLLLIPSLLLISAAGFYLFARDRRYENRVDFLFCLVFFFTGMSVINMMIRFPEERLNFFALVILIISGFLFFKIRYLFAGVTACLISAIYGWTLFYVADMPVIEPETVFFFLITIVSMAAGYKIEYQSRLIFLRSCQLQQTAEQIRQTENLRNKELVRINKSLEIEILAHTEAESRLKESEEKYRNLVVSLPEGIFIVQDQKIVFFNPSMEKLTGYDAGTLPGKVAKSLFVEDKSDNTEAYEPFQDFFVRMDGEKIFIEKSCVDIVYHSAPAKLYTVRDVTEKAMVIRDKKKLKKELERAKRMEAFGILAGGVAHDLNNVLSGLVSTPELLLMDLPEDSPFIEHVEVIKDSGKRAAVIVDELLTMARGAGKMPEPVLFNHVIEDYFLSPEFDRLMADHPDVEIVKNLDSRLPFILASVIHMRKLVMNLVANAVEAVGKNTGRVVVKTCGADLHHHEMKGYGNAANGKYVEFSVRDTGKGISEEDLDHIFEPFYSKKILGRSGTGLGLSIVWTAVHDHKGYIHLDRQKDQTCFTLYFPVSENPDVAQKQDNVYTLSDYSGNNEKILVIDDMKSQQKIVGNILRRLGYSVTVVSSGEEALLHAEDNKIDLVVLDMIMEPGLSGLETFQQLLLIDPEIKAIITSGYPETRDVKKAQALGAGEFIKKPYSLQQIGLALKKELSGREA